MMKRLLTLFTLFILTSFPTILLAQPGLPDGPEQTPLGGIELLAAAGGAYAIKKLKERRE